MSEDKQNKNKPKKTEDKALKITINIISSFIISFLIIINSIINTNSGCSGMSYTNETIARSLLQSLQSAAAIYVAQERKPPAVFSDFVTPEGAATEPYTLSLENLETSEIRFNSTQLTLSLKPIYDDYKELKVTYYLNGTDVTTDLNYEQEKKRDYLKDLLNSLFFIACVIGISICIFFFLQLFNNPFLYWLILFLLIGGILSSIAVPKFTKPAIYLYPTKPTEVNITLDKRINLTLDVPKYVPDKGWHILTNPDGKIVDLQPQYTNCNDLNPNIFGLEYAKDACLKNNYPYIYWEGDSFKHQLPLQNKGWLVKTKNIKVFLNTKLNYVGFNKKEKDEFIRYWAHQIVKSKKETVFISFIQTDTINDYLPMSVAPTPDSINRFYIIIDLNVNNHKNPQPQELIKFKRKGFTLVDWGGAIM